MEIIEYSIEELVDPTGIIDGQRYEFRLYIQFDIEDELHKEEGTGLRILFAVDEQGERIASYHFFERATEKVLDFEMEDDEIDFVTNFCKEQLS